VKNAGLAKLGSYGGPTETMPLLPGSPAIGAGVGMKGVTVDERGSKLASPAPDIGAYQSQGFTISVVNGGTPQSAVVNNSFANPLEVLVEANDPGVPVTGGVVTFTVPSAGASAVLSSATATIGSDGEAKVTAKANSSGGSYTVSASAAGASGAAEFQLTNQPAPGKAVSDVELVALAVLKRNKLKSVKLEAEFDPPDSGAALPTGTVKFELLQPKKKPKQLAKVKLTSGTATLSENPSKVLNKSIEIIYSGDANYQASSSTATVAQSSLAPSRRAMVRVSRPTTAIGA
jgi:hypothetical protein